VSVKTGKKITLKDISNIQSKTNSGCNLDTLVTRLRENDGKMYMLGFVYVNILALID